MTSGALVTPKQEHVLKLLSEWHQGTMAASPANYRRIAAEIGWKSYWAVPEALYALRLKGKVRSLGTSVVSPETWEVVSE